MAENRYGREEENLGGSADKLRAAREEARRLGSELRDTTSAARGVGQAATEASRQVDRLRTDLDAARGHLRSLEQEYERARVFKVSDSQRGLLRDMEEAHRRMQSMSTQFSPGAGEVPIPPRQQRTLDALIRRGLAEQAGSGTTARITDFGRSVAAPSMVIEDIRRQGQYIAELEERYESAQRSMTQSAREGTRARALVGRDYDAQAGRGLAKLREEFRVALRERTDMSMRGEGGSAMDAALERERKALEAFNAGQERLERARREAGLTRFVRRGNQGYGVGRATGGERPYWIANEEGRPVTRGRFATRDAAERAAGIARTVGVATMRVQRVEGGTLQTQTLTATTVRAPAGDTPPARPALTGADAAMQEYIRARERRDAITYARRSQAELSLGRYGPTAETRQILQRQFEDLQQRFGLASSDLTAKGEREQKARMDAALARVEAAGRQLRLTRVDPIPSGQASTPAMDTVAGRRLLGQLIDRDAVRLLPQVAESLGLAGEELQRATRELGSAAKEQKAAAREIHTIPERFMVAKQMEEGGTWYAGGTHGAREDAVREARAYVEAGGGLARVTDRIGNTLDEFSRAVDHAANRVVATPDQYAQPIGPQDDPNRAARAAAEQVERNKAELARQEEYRRQQAAQRRVEERRSPYRIVQGTDNRAVAKILGFARSVEAATAFVDAARERHEGPTSGRDARNLPYYQPNPRYDEAYARRLEEEEREARRAAAAPPPPPPPPPPPTAPPPPPDDDRRRGGRYNDPEAVQNFRDQVDPLRESRAILEQIAGVSGDVTDDTARRIELEKEEQRLREQAARAERELADQTERRARDIVAVTPPPPPPPTEPPRIAPPSPDPDDRAPKGDLEDAEKEAANAERAHRQAAGALAAAQQRQADALAGGDRVAAGLATRELQRAQEREAAASERLTAARENLNRHMQVLGTAAQAEAEAMRRAAVQASGAAFVGGLQAARAADAVRANIQRQEIGERQETQRLLEQQNRNLREHVFNQRREQVDAAQRQLGPGPGTALIPHPTEFGRRPPPRDPNIRPDIIPHPTEFGRGEYQYDERIDPYARRTGRLRYPSDRPGAREERVFGQVTPGAAEAYARAAREAENALSDLDAEQRRARNSARAAAVEMGTASTAMHRHGAMTTEFITAAARGETSIREMGTQALLTAGKFAAWTAAAGAVYGALGAIRQLGEGVIQTQSGIAQIGRVIPPESFDSQDASQALRDLSEQFNVPIEVAADAVYRMGQRFHELPNAIEAARASLYSFKVGEVDVATSTQNLIAITNGFGLQATDLSSVFNQINEAQNQFGIRIGDTEAGLAKAAGTWRAAGGDLQGLLPLFVAIGRATNRSGQEIGTGLSRSQNFLRQAKQQQQLIAQGITPNPDDIEETFRQAFAAARKPGADVYGIASGLLGPQYARLLTGVLQDQGTYNRAREELDPGRVEVQTSAARELDKVLSEAREQIAAVGNELQQLGAALYEIGAFDVFGAMLRGINLTLGLATDLVEVFAQLPSPIREGLVYMGQLYLLLGLMRRTGITAGLAERFPTLRGLDRPEQRMQRQTIRGLRDQTDFLTARREQATARYAAAAFDREDATERRVIAGRALHEYERDSYARQQPVDPGRHAQLSSAYERSLEDERAARRRESDERDRSAQTTRRLRQSEEELNRVRAMSPVQAAAWRRQNNVPVPGTLTTPSSLGAIYPRMTVDQSTARRSMRFTARVPRLDPDDRTPPVRRTTPRLVDGRTQFRASVSSVRQLTQEQNRLQRAAQNFATSVNGLGVSGRALGRTATLAAGATSRAGGALRAVPAALGRVGRGIGGMLGPLDGIIIAAVALSHIINKFNEDSERASESIASLQMGGSSEQMRDKVRQIREDADGFWSRVQDAAKDLGDVNPFRDDTNTPRERRLEAARKAEREIARKERLERRGIGLTQAQIRENLTTSFEGADTEEERIRAVRRAQRQVRRSLVSRGTGGEIAQEAQAQTKATIADMEASLNQGRVAFEESLENVFAAADFEPFVNSLENIVAQFGQGRRSSGRARALAGRLRELAARSRSTEETSKLLQLLQQVEGIERQGIEDRLRRALAVATNDRQIQAAKTEAVEAMRKLLVSTTNARIRRIGRQQRRLKALMERLEADQAQMAAGLAAELAGSVSGPPAPADAGGLGVIPGGIGGLPRSPGGSLGAKQGEIEGTKKQIEANAKAQAKLRNIRKESQDILDDFDRDAAGQAESRSEELKADAEAAKQAAEEAAARHRAITGLRFDLQAAGAHNNALGQARIGVARAGAMLGLATNEEERLQALVEQRNANNELADALADREASRFERLAAMTDDPRRQARYERIAAGRDRRRYRRGTAEWNRADARYQQSRRAEMEATVESKRDDIQFGLDMDRIGTDTAIQMYRNLLNLKGITKRVRRDILRQIKDLQEDEGDYNVNVGDVKLPTLYEIRRAVAGGGAHMTQVSTVNTKAEIHVHGSDNPEAVATAVVSRLDRGNRTAGRAAARARGFR